MTDPQDRRNGIVVTFDSLCGPGLQMGPLPSDYLGFVWNENAWYLSKEGYSSIHTARRAVLFNAHGGDVLLERRPAFDLKGLSLFSLWKDTVGVLVEAWERGACKYREEVTVYRNAVTRPELNFRDVDRLVLSAGGAHFAVEDIFIVDRGMNGDS